MFLKQGEIVFFDEAKKLIDVYSYAKIEREPELSTIE